MPKIMDPMVAVHNLYIYASPHKRHFVRPRGSVRSSSIPNPRLKRRRLGH